MKQTLTRGVVLLRREKRICGGGIHSFILYSLKIKVQVMGYTAM